MNTESILTIVLLGLGLLVTLVTLVIALCRGEMKETVKKLMVEAEATGKAGPEKLKYVLQGFADKYKIFQFLLNCKKFVEQVIKITKKINAK